MFPMFELECLGFIVAWFFLAVAWDKFWARRKAIKGTVHRVKRVSWVKVVWDHFTKPYDPADD